MSRERTDRKRSIKNFSGVQFKTDWRGETKQDIIGVSHFKQKGQQFGSIIQLVKRIIEQKRVNLKTNLEGFHAVVIEH